MVARLPPRDAPVVGSPVARDGEKTTIEIASGRRRLTVERAHRPRGLRRRDRDEQNGEERERVRERTLPRGHERVQTRERTCGGAREHQHGEAERDAVTRARRVVERVALCRQGGLARCEPHRDQGGRGGRSGSEAECEPARLERDEHDRSDRERKDRAAAEREIERRREQDDGCTRERPRAGTARMSHVAERQEEPDRREEPEGVGVVEASGEPKARLGVERGPVREQVPGQRVAGDQGHGRGRPGGESVASLTLRRDGDERRSGCDVDEHPLGLEERERRRWRPERRERRPTGEQHQGEKERGRGARHAHVRANDERSERHEQEAE
jgi:hypothetical protein